MSENVKVAKVECASCGAKFERAFDAKYVTEAVAGANLAGEPRAFVHGPCLCGGKGKLKYYEKYDEDAVPSGRVKLYVLGF